MANASTHVHDSGLEPLRLIAVLRSAGATYRARFSRVAGIAIVVFLLPGLLSTGVDQWAEHHGRHLPGVATMLIIAGVANAAGSVLASTMYAGVLDAVVGEHRFSHPERGAGEVLRKLPYARLIVASMVVSAATGLAALAFVIPGIIVYAFLSLTGPIINIEGLGVLAALRRSIHLVRRRFWLAVWAVAVPAAIESWLDDAVDLAFHGTPWLATLMVDGLLAITILAFVGLVEVTLAHELILRDRPAAGSTTITSA